MRIRRPLFDRVFNGQQIVPAGSDTLFLGSLTNDTLPLLPIYGLVDLKNVKSQDTGAISSQIRSFWIWLGSNTPGLGVQSYRVTYPNGAVTYLDVNEGIEPVALFQGQPISGPGVLKIEILTSGGSVWGYQLSDA